MFKTLLLDDDSASPTLMQRYLDSLSHSVVCTRTVLGALNRLDRESFDFLVIQVPFREQMGALALCRVLKSDSKTSNTRVLLIGEAGRIRAQARAAGVDSILNTPYTIDDVRFSIGTLADSRMGRQPLMFGMTVHEAVEANSRALLGWLRGPI